jgi:tetratricopeptide (TPR) repeat protein
MITTPIATREPQQSSRHVFFNASAPMDHESRGGLCLNESDFDAVRGSPLSVVMASEPLNSTVTEFGACPVHAGTRPARARAARFLWLLSAVLGGVGAWRLATDLRPLPDLGAIEAMVARGELDRAKSVLVPWIERSPRHGGARRLLARVFAQQNDLRACAEQLHRVPEWWPSKREDRFLEGESYQKLDMARLAERAWRACVADDPLHPMSPGYLNGAAKALVALYVLEDWRSEARDVLWEVFPQVAPEERPVILATLLRVESERIEPKEAAATLSRYVEADPGDWNARLALARNLDALGERARCDRLVADCLAERPDDLAAWRTWLEILTERNEPVELERALARMPSELAGAPDAPLQRIRGAAFEARGELSHAAEALRTAVELDPHDDQAHFRLARVARRLELLDDEQHHRERHQAIRQARDEIASALADYRRLHEGTGDGLDRSAVFDRLARVSEAIGRDRLAREWRRLRSEPG